MTEEKKAMVRAQICAQTQIAEGIFSLWLEVGEMAAQAQPGQFVSVYSGDRSRLLPRPISICEAEPQTGRIRLVYRIAGAGTREFSSLKEGDALRILGPLGNGFPLEKGGEGKRALLFGGGIGIPPMVELAKRLPGEKILVAGYRSEPFLKEELSRHGRLVIATEDGSEGTGGTVLDAVRAQDLQADVYFACGPMPMLRALKEWGDACQIPGWLSMEQRMACGIGACLACVCETAHTDPHSQVHNARACADGPVFSARDLVLSA